MDIPGLISTIDGYIWGLPLMMLLLGTGIYLTIRNGFVQGRGFLHAFKILSGKFDKKDDPGEVSHFGALTTALSATIGTGNIVGVAAAIAAGGPGAVFWMWVTAFFGMATKFASCTLAVHFRRVDESGEIHGGPMHFIEMGLGPKYRWLALSFAFLTAGASFGIGNMFQANNVAAAVNSLVYGADAASSTTVNVAVGLICAVLVAAVILGGIKRIAAFAGKVVPFMCAFYVIIGLAILAKFAGRIPEGIGLILHHAFHAPESVAGGLLGGVIRSGVSRGLFSNEAGLGSAPIAHAAAKTDEPIREGLVALLEPFIDTLMICSITALVIVCTGAYEMGFEKGKLTAAAFGLGFPGAGKAVAVATIFFAFSTLVSWSYYGDRAVDYLFGKKAVVPYRVLYIGFIFLGAVIKLGWVIDFCDAMNGLMAIPNLIALLMLSPLIAKLLNDYMARMRAEGTL
ncbi:MAG: sodium:alanine symporter family protein [Elusimicrobia bacterium]|nr:MAG: sodium:alanine symporter family protein [Elusimicrobiota bacterium]